MIASLESETSRNAEQGIETEIHLRWIRGLVTGNALCSADPAARISTGVAVAKPTYGE
jgi:hypothetical protein